MGNYFNQELDTTGPMNPTISINNGAHYATSRIVNCTIGTSDQDTIDYTMKLWGDVALDYDEDVQDSELSSNWISFSNSKDVKLSATEGNKTVYLKLRDDVANPSEQTSASIVLDTTLPVVTITGPDITRISKQPGSDESSFSFEVSKDFDEFKVMVVTTPGSAHTTGTQLPTTGGSSNMSGSSGDYSKDLPITCKINGSDLEAASSGDGIKTIKVFVKDKAGLWSE